MDRDEFMELVYETFAEEPDNVLANGIIEAADAYVEHEKAQLFKEDATSDLISRQEAIDAVDAIGHIATMSDGDKCIRRSAVKYTLSMLPTSQPVATDTNVGDTISRQAAIDALDVLCQEHRYRIPGKRETYSEYNEAWQDALDRAEGLIFNLPTIQPESHERYWIDKGWNGDWAWQIDGRGNCWRVIECSECGKGVSVESNYCPHCGAHMKGAKHESN